jgi:hypothetical protein
MGMQHTDNLAQLPKPQGLLHTLLCLHAGRLALPWTAHLEHQEVWSGPSWSSTALQYDVAFFWSINPFYHNDRHALVQHQRCL